MKLTATAAVKRLWIMLLLTGLSMFTVSSLSSAATLKIGDNYGGGVVFYIDGTGQHGLIAAKSDAMSHSYAKMEGFFTWHNAEEAANTFVEGYCDWFLPNKAQLNQLYLHRSAVGGFSDTIYWSSSEGDADNAWGQNFNSGDQLIGKKTNGSHVRAVRAF
jgi:hypothetical protein